MERGKRLKILRMLYGLSQEDLAKRLGVSQGNVATWERKNMFPRDTKIAVKLAAALQVSVGYLAYGEGKIDSAAWEPIPPNNPRHLQSYLTDFVELFFELSKEVQIEQSFYYSTDKGTIFFLGPLGKQLNYLLIAEPTISASVNNLITKSHCMKALDKDNPPPFIHLREFDSYMLITFASMVSKAKVDVKSLEINLLQLRKQNNRIYNTFTPELIGSTFTNFIAVLQEFEVRGPLKPELLNSLHTLFMKTYDVCHENSLLLHGETNEELTKWIRSELERIGFHQWGG